uniref:Uncharacterized protein n=1 Tax=Mycobacterium sp. (strain KMS) TaxID=189918 RepID=A1UPZ7_MYCSK
MRPTSAPRVRSRIRSSWRRFLGVLFVSIRGSVHYSGKYWAATERDHVIYESRLELSSLLLADFDPAVIRVVAQPFRLSAVVNGRLRRHIPDFLWGSGLGLTVVDVVRAQRLAENPKIQMLCEWTREVLECRRISSSG